MTYGSKERAKSLKSEELLLACTHNSDLSLTYILLLVLKGYKSDLYTKDFVQLSDNLIIIIITVVYYKLDVINLKMNCNGLIQIGCIL